MNRKVYIANKVLALAEYCPKTNDRSYYECWQDPATQDGYNYKMCDSYDEFCDRPIRSRLLAVIIRNDDNEPLGIVSLSPEGSPPDLAIMLYKPHRGKGYGTKAFAHSHLNIVLKHLPLTAFTQGAMRIMRLVAKCLKPVVLFHIPMVIPMRLTILLENPLFSMIMCYTEILDL